MELVHVRLKEPLVFDRTEYIQELCSKLMASMGLFDTLLGRENVLKFVWLIYVDFKIENNKKYSGDPSQMQSATHENDDGNHRRHLWT